jgi:hypothetical protein
VQLALIARIRLLEDALGEALCHVLPGDERPTGLRAGRCSMTINDARGLGIANNPLAALDIVRAFQLAYIGSHNADRDPATVEPEDVRRLRESYEDNLKAYDRCDDTRMAAFAEVARLQELLASARSQTEYAQAEVLRMRPVVDAAERWRALRHNTFSMERINAELEAALSRLESL